MSVRGLEDPKQVALLTIECQNAITDSSFEGNSTLQEQCESRKIIPRIADLSRACRLVGIPILHSTLTHRPDWAGSNVNSPLLGASKKRKRLLTGTPDVELNSGLQAQPSDFVLDRIHGVTAFYGSALDQILRNCGVRTLILTGVSTNLGIIGAAIEAVNRGFAVVVAEDCTAGVWEEAHEFIVENLLPPLAVVTSSTDIMASLAATELD